MGFEEVQSNSGYMKFNKGANLLIKPSDIEPDDGEYKGSKYQQLKFLFDAVPENGGEQGRVPGWLSSKITIRESDEHTSDLGKFLVAAGILDQVLRDLGADDELIRKVKAGDERFEAKDHEENLDLLNAVAKSLGGVVLRAGSSWNSKEDYSVVKEFYERVDEDPFADDAVDGGDSPASESSDEGDGSVVAGEA